MLKYAHFIVLLNLSLLLLAQSSHESGATINHDLQVTIAKVRSEKTVESRTEAARHLAVLTRQGKPDDVTDETFKDIVALLETDEDSVRYWVAASLSNFGPRASPAAPALFKLLLEVDCLPGSLTSAISVRTALKRMGVTPWPRKCEPPLK